MIPLSRHITTVKAKPHHVRKQVAFATAFLVAAVIALVWAGASFATNAFAIKGSSFAASTGATPSVVAGKQSAASLTASVGNAGQQDSSAPGIEIVDAPSTASAPASQPTTISF